MAPQYASGPFSRDHIPTIYIYAEYVPEFRGPLGPVPASVVLGTLSRNWGQEKMKVEPDSCQLGAGDRRWTLPCRQPAAESSSGPVPLRFGPKRAPTRGKRALTQGRPYGQFVVHLHKILGVGTNSPWQKSSRHSTVPASRRTALRFAHILPVCSRIAPCPAGAGPVSVLVRLSPRTANTRLFWSRRSASPDRHSPATTPSWLRIGPFRPPRQPPEASPGDAGNRSVPQREEPPC